MQDAKKNEKRARLARKEAKLMKEVQPVFKKISEAFSSFLNLSKEEQEVQIEPMIDMAVKEATGKSPAFARMLFDDLNRFYFGLSGVAYSVKAEEFVDATQGKKRDE